MDDRPKTLLLFLLLSIPLGFVMDLVHELGHAMFGIAAGGTLTYLKVAYIEIFPQLAITRQFQLGYAVVTGLTDFGHGLFLLGGSTTTNIIAWLLVLIMSRKTVGKKAQVALKTLIFFGHIDLPLYVLLPQIGLRHWILTDGDTPEPLIGARKLGLPDTTFYTMLALTTVGLAIVYIDPLRRAARKIGTRLALKKSEHGLWFEKVIPGLIFISLWLDGGFFPLLLLPLLYVLLVEKKTLRWLGFQKNGLWSSASLGAIISVALSLAYYPVLLRYQNILRQGTVGPYDILTDVFWYPLYEEITYRSFFLSHFTEPNTKLSSTNMLANLLQSLLFLSIHGHHFASGIYLVLALVFMLGLLNGILFLRTRNIYGSLISHSILNGFALLLRQIMT